MKQTLSEISIMQGIKIATQTCAICESALYSEANVGHTSINVTTKIKESFSNSLCFKTVSIRLRIFPIIVCLFTLTVYIPHLTTPVF